jgi:peptidoglycan-associated lipoprotein
MYPSRHVAAPLLLIVAVVAGCSRKRASPTPETPAAPVVNGDARADSLARADAARRDSLAKEASLREARERRLAEARAAIAAPVYFAYDRSNLSAEARGILDAKAPILSASPALRLRLNGHTDDRGSDEYNLALGQRRAASARAYLTALGVPAARLEITSFGEEEPVCRESGDSCWSRNRRVEFDIMAGADMIVVR